MTLSVQPADTAAATLKMDDEIERTTEKPKPHLVYVLSDNLGWGNVRIGSVAWIAIRASAQSAMLSHFVDPFAQVGYHRATSAAGPSPEVVTPNIDELVCRRARLLSLAISPATFGILLAVFFAVIGSHILSVGLPLPTGCHRHRVGSPLHLQVLLAKQVESLCD